MSASHDKLTELFGEALDLDSDARAVLVERLRHSDPPLAEELAALLAADDKAERSARAILATGALAETVDERPARHGRAPRIPGYRLLAQIGEGGMGTVYEAQQEEPRRRVAIKLLFARSDHALVRFKAEAQIMARLDHPGIARVLEAGDADGQPYLVMEHVEGKSLDAHALALDRDARLRVFIAICDAVHHAHLKGVIHRDLKPSNVIVRPDGRPVILDFGVARLASDDGSTPGATRAGELIGTPLYMSPEQAQLRADAVDARSDVYTLGVILYELLSGELPYAIRELPLPAVTAAICSDPAVRLGRRDPALRGDLEAIADKALAKEPAARYQSVASLADDVRKYLEGAPVSVRALGTLERARRFARRRPMVTAAIAAAVIATATFATVVTALWLDARAARRRAEDAHAAAEVARARLERRTNELTLKQARAALDRDPTEALAWLRTLAARDAAPGAAWAVFDEAIARGVAQEVLRGHTDEVHWVEAIPRSEAFVSSGYDGRVIIWEPPAFAPRTLLQARHGRVHAARPSPDGTLVAVGADDGEAYVIALDGSVVAELAGHVGDVQHLAWSPDGRWLATGDDSGRVHVWSRAGSRELVASNHAIGAIAFAGDSSALIAGDHAGTIWSWSTRTWTARAADLGADIVTAWTDGSRAAAVDANGNLHTWNVTDNALAGHAVIATRQKIKRALFASDGHSVTLGGFSGAVTQLDGTNHVALGAHRSQVRSLAISADGRWLAHGGDDGMLVLHELHSGRDLVLRGHAGRIRHLELTTHALLSADSEGVVRRWELDALGPLLLRADREVTRLASDGTHVAAIDSDGMVFVWTLDDGARRRLGHQGGRVTALTLITGTVVTGTAEGDVTWWLPTPVTVNVHGVVTSLAASHGRVAVASNSGPISLFTATGEATGTLPGHAGGTDALAFDPSGAVLASGGQDRKLRLWRRDGDAFVASATAGGLQGDTHFVAFTEDSSRVVAGGNDGAVIAWPVDDGRLGEGHRLAQHTGAITALAIGPHHVVSAGRDARVIRVPLGDGPAVTTTLASSAIALAIDASGDVHAVTRDGAVERAGSERGAIELDHGVRAGVALSANRWVLAHDDGSLVIVPLSMNRPDTLGTAIARATRYTLPAP